jgi:hypothetical protein
MLQRPATKLAEFGQLQLLLFLSVGNENETISSQEMEPTRFSFPDTILQFV